MSRNGGALIFRVLSFRGSLVAYAAGRIQQRICSVEVGPFDGADRRLVGSAIGVTQFVNAHGTRGSSHTKKESLQNTGWPLTSSGGASRTDQKVSRKGM